MYQEPESRHRDVGNTTLGDRFGIPDSRRRDVAFATLADFKWGELKHEDTQGHRFTPVAKEISRPYWFKPGFFEPNQFIAEVNQLPLFKEMNAQLLADVPHALGYFQEHMFKNAPDSLMQQMWSLIEKNWFVWSAKRFDLNSHPQDILEASVGLQKLRASAPVQTEIPEEWRAKVFAIFSEMVPDGTEQTKPHLHKKIERSAKLPDKKPEFGAKDINTERHLRNLGYVPTTKRIKLKPQEFLGTMEAWVNTPGMRLSEEVRTGAFAYLITEMPTFDHAQLKRALGIAATLDYAPAEFMKRWETGAMLELNNFTIEEQLSCMSSIKKLGKKAFPEFENAYRQHMADNVSKLDDKTLAEIVENQSVPVPNEILAEYIVRTNGGTESGALPPLTSETFVSLAEKLPTLNHSGLSRVLAMATESGNASRDFLKKWERAAEKHLTKFTAEEHLSNMSCFRAESTKASATLRKAYWDSTTQNMGRLDHKSMMEVLRTAADQGSSVPERLFSPYAKQMDFELPNMTSEEAIHVLWDLAAISVTTELPAKVLDMAHDMLPIAEMNNDLTSDLRRMRYEAFQRFFPSEVKSRRGLIEAEEKVPVSEAVKSFYDGLNTVEEELGLSVTVENEDKHAFRIKGRFVCIDIDNASDFVPDTSGKTTTYTGKTLLQTALVANENPDGVVVHLNKDLAAQIAVDDGHAAERFESIKREVVKLYPGAYTASYDGKRFDLEPMEIPQVPAWTPKGFQHPVDELDMA